MLKHLRALIAPDRARPAPNIRPGEPQRYESDQTTHFSIVDDAGDAVANTYTLNLPYGSGLRRGGDGGVARATMSSAASPRQPGAANVYGPPTWRPTAMHPGAMERSTSSMSPTLVLKDGRLLMATGKVPAASTWLSPRWLATRLNVIDRASLDVGESREYRRARTASAGYADEFAVDGSSGRTPSACSRRWDTRWSSATPWARPTRSFGRERGAQGRLGFAPKETLAVGY